LWGASNYLALSDGNFEHQLFIAFILAGLSSGSAVVYSIEIFSALAFVIFSVIPMALFFLFSGHSTLIAMSVACFLYTIFIIVSIKGFNQRLIESIMLRIEAVENAKEIEHLAFYDVLTGLSNRRLLTEKLEHAFVSSWRTGKRCAIMFIDLDHFKLLNDTLGHNKGDELLKQVADRLEECVRESDTVSRFGGDEFVIMLENLNEVYKVALKEAKQISKLILANLNQPYHLIDVEYMLTPSIGIAMMGEHGRTQQDLLRHADIAMYNAKKSGRNAVKVYVQKMEKEINLE
jgi:diguanylate cyclase (GGDEF)-like protein